MTWLTIPGYEGIYEVSDRGQVQALDRVVEQISRWGAPVQRHLRGRILSLSLTGEYLTVGLRRDGQHTTRTVHGLVLEAFAGPCPPGKEARHGPGGKQDNRWPENLCWGTHIENEQDKRREGTLITGSCHRNAKLNEDQVREIRVRYAAGGISMQALAGEFGVSPMAICKLVTGKTWRHVDQSADVYNQVKAGLGR